jgi:crotonobetaine/carnitine-CoA ligase
MMTMVVPSLDGWVVGQVLARQAARRPDHPYLELPGQEPISFAAMDAVASRLANGLAALGIGFGDTVLLMLCNGAEFLQSWFALSRLGAVTVPINIAFKGDFLEYVVNDSAARVIIADAELLPALRHSEARLDHLATAVAVGAPAAAGFERCRVVPFADLLSFPATAPAVDVTYRDTGAILYTSGTTGPSRGVLLPHGHLHHNPQVYIEQLGLTEDDVFYCCLPLFHANALLLHAYGALILGCRLVLVRNFSASNWLADIRRYGATVTNLLGAMTEFVLRQPERQDDHDNPLRIACTVPIPVSFGAAFEHRFGVKLIELYGTTELNCPFYMPRDAALRPGSCGRLLDDWFECRIADAETDEALPVGSTGELLVRPKVLGIFMVGYHGKPEATVQAWRNLWFHTGDALRCDAEGYYYFVDRLKDCIRRRGENISSYEVEQVLIGHPAVAEAAVVGVLSRFDEREQEVKAAIVLAQGAALLPADLAAFCRARMPDFAVPRYIEILDALPRTATQKIRKDLLRASGITQATWEDPEIRRRRPAGGAAP